MSRRNSGDVRRRPLATRCRRCRDRRLHLGNAEIRAPHSGHPHAASGARRRDRTRAKGRCGVTDGKIKLKATICCIVCSRVSERPLIAAEGEAEGEGIVICPHCLAEGDIDAKLERHAARLESRSRWLRALIGRLEVPSPAVLKEFAGPEDIEQVAAFWDSLSDLLDESEQLPINQAAHRLVSLLQEYRGAWPLIKSDAEVDPERGKALAAALAKRREFFG